MNQRSRTALTDDFDEIVRQGRELERGERHDRGRNPELAHNALWQLCRLIRSSGLVSEFMQNRTLETGLATDGTKQFFVVGRYVGWRLGVDVWGKFYLVNKRWQGTATLSLVCDPMDDLEVSPLVSHWPEDQIWRLFLAFAEGLTPLRDKILQGDKIP